MAVDINHAPPGGFQNGGWYWDPSAGQARQYWAGSFGAPNVINNPSQQGFGQSVGSGTPAPSSPAPVNSSPSQSVDQMIKDSFQKLQTEANQKFKDYNSANPFNYDQVLADKTTQAKEQLDPYYNESLSNYLLGVTRKVQNSASDTRDLLGELSAQTDSFGRDTQLKLTDAINKAGQGFADAGLFDSGARFNAQGSATTGAQNSLADYTRGQNYRALQANNANDRVQQDYGLGNFSADNSTAPIPGSIANQDIRDMARQRATDTSTLASKLTGEAGQQYVSGFEQTLPPELQANNNFDLLKQIGVYS